ncbi:MAG: TonB-dependent receptor [Acidobacteria bacterium]|nr:TonB-dependent receptor [Acidobacteriota bacterium]
MHRLRIVLLIPALLPAAAGAQPAGAGQVGPIQLPPVIVTAQKEPADAQTLPVSLTAVGREVLAGAGITVLREAGIYAPNVQFTDFTARKLSNPRFRGIGSSPANPAITTYFDGVPQLHSNTSSLDLLDVEQVEFVRGPQSALFGRNTLAGVINVTSTRPSLTDWSYSLAAPLSNFDSRNIGANVSGPLASGRVGVSGAIAYGRRDGFTRNVVTGHDVDSRSAFTGKGQLLWARSPLWETRLIVTGERARDGDYALNDLAAIRRNPFEVSRDFEGYTHRDLVATTVLVRRAGSAVTVSSTTGLVNWKTEDETDLDYTALPLLRRLNTEKSLQFTQEVRVASAPNASPRILEDVPLKWQAGVFLFTQHYDQDAVNRFSPFVLSPLLPLPVSQHAPQAALDDIGLGLYGQATATVIDALDITVGARLDHENKEASLNTFFTPAIAPGRLVEPEESFSNVSPRVAVAYRLQADRMVYAAVARGFKAGGFNPASPAGFEAYGEEHTWNVEGGVKTAWLGGRLTANAAVFRIDWDDLQLNLPDPLVPAQFFIANVGRAASKGAEFELNARVRPGVDLFTAIGFTDATFKARSVSSGVVVAGNEIPNTPDYTATFGGVLSRTLRGDATVYGRAEVTFYGAFQYDDLNRAGQEAYSLTNVRAGVRRGNVFADAWVRNAFDTRYVPVAFAYDPRLAPSGFLGEPGAPRTFGIGIGVGF